MLQIVATCISRRQWGQISKIESRSIDAVRAEYDTSYQRVEPVQKMRLQPNPEPIAKPRKIYPWKEAFKASMTDEDRNYALWLKAQMDELGLTIMELAKMAHASAATISDIKNLIMRANPPVRERIASALLVFRRNIQFKAAAE